MPDRALARELTLPAAVALVIGQVIAVGIFLTPGTIIRALASPLWIIAAWVTMGALAICGALAYGALAGKFPQAGGGYVYLRETFGSRVAFLYGWKCLLIMDPGVTAALATGFAAYAAYLVPLDAVTSRLAAAAAIFVLAGVHVIGLRPGARLLKVLAVTKIVLILALVAAALAGPVGGWEHFMPFVERRPGSPPLGAALAAAFVSVFFAFGGWWEVTKIAGEMKDPRTLPRALWIGLLAVTILYLTTTLAFVYVLPMEQVQPGEAFVAQVGSEMLGASGGRIVALVVVICVLGSLGSMLMVAPRLYFAMAHDGLFPEAAAAVHPRYHTPARAILLQAVLASILVVLGTFESIVSYFVFITVVFIALTVGGVFVLKRRDPAWDVPGYPWTPALFLAMVAALLVVLAMNAPLQAILGAAVVAAGLPVYSMVEKRRPLAAGARTREI
ncbi:MAG TPA: amino acid permease [Vicinamibacterales bacterium]|nr:amino acid permease [Vicinamibacterales bacterium]